MSGQPTTALEPVAKVEASARGQAVRGVLLMFVSTFFFAAMHASIRHVSTTIHPFEIAFFRSLFALIVVLPWFLRDGFAPLRTRRIGLHGLRAVFNVCAMLSFFYALTIAPFVAGHRARVHRADLRDPARGAGPGRGRAPAPLDRDRGRLPWRGGHLFGPGST
jgi:hypothetical protein